MRSITLKLILSFLAISIVCVILIVALAYWNTGREFKNFIFDQNRSVLVTELTNFYTTHGSWDNLNYSTIAVGLTTNPEVGAPPAPPFMLVDNAGTVIITENGANIGGTYTITTIERGIPIEVNNVQVGTLLVDQGSFQPKPAETNFIQRNMWLLIYSAIGVALLALITAIFLSRGITRPIRELTQATHAVADGELGRQVKVRARDEIGLLSTAFNKMSSDLQRSVKVRRQMTADIAHELRTPLSIILGHADAVHDGMLPANSKNFEIIREEAARLEHIVEDLRTLSLADAGELSMNFQKVSIEKLLTEIVDKYNLQARKKDVELKVEVEPGLPDLKIDPGRMNQVLQNILENALRHTPRKGTIIIGSQKTNNNLELSVQDTGEGVKPEDLDRIFERLYRANPSRKRDEGGSGLGLAIAKSIIELHNGKIMAEPSGDKGLKIRIVLPVK